MILAAGVFRTRQLSASLYNIMPGVCVFVSKLGAGRLTMPSKDVLPASSSWVTSGRSSLPSTSEVPFPFAEVQKAEYSSAYSYHIGMRQQTLERAHRSSGQASRT